ncbi:MAG: lysoplasmalogenase [Bacteroidia bacterium]|nr:lysoplasmalogenase [Bacteroidia bacterium]
MQFKVSWGDPHEPFRAFSRVFAAIAAAELASNFFIRSVPLAHYLIKPLIVLSLLALFLRQAGGLPRRVRSSMTAALLCSLAGDVLLMLPDRAGWAFPAGLGAFLLAQGSLIAAYTYRPQAPAAPGLLMRKPWILLFYLGYGLGLLGLLYPELGPLTIPVVAYATVLLSMSAAALSRWRQAPDASFGRVFMGSLLFVLSDSLIAIDRFGAEVLPIQGAKTWIMATYMAAQYLMVTGMLLDRQPRQAARS